MNIIKQKFKNHKYERLVVVLKINTSIYILFKCHEKNESQYMSIMMKS